MLVRGMTNEASGKWIYKPDEAYIRRAAVNRERNLVNRKRSKVVASTAWATASEKAHRELRKEGDNSEPLDWYVSQFLPGTKRHPKNP